MQRYVIKHYRMLLIIQLQDGEEGDEPQEPEKPKSIIKQQMEEEKLKRMAKKERVDEEVSLSFLFSPPVYIPLSFVFVFEQGYNKIFLCFVLCRPLKRGQAK